jgi:hypothetical protein
VRVERIRPGTPLEPRLDGAVLACDLTVGGQAWSKGRRLGHDDLGRLASELVAAGGA